MHRCLPLFISVHRCCLQSPENSSGTGTSNGCEPPCGCRSLNSGPVEEQPVLLTSEPSLLPCQYSLFKPSPALLLNSLFCIQTHTTFPHFSTSPLELASTACLPLEQKDPSRDDVRIASLEKTLSISGSYLAAHGADTSESPSDIPMGLCPAMSTTGKESLARMENPY